MKIKHLTLKWTVSKGRDTYGYNIVTLYDTSTHKKFRVNGGGYDMVGTVFGDWLKTEYQDQLLAIKERAGSTYTLEGRTANNTQDALYGMAYISRNGKISLDGACGIDCMITIAEAISLTVQRIPDAKGNLLGFNVVEG